MSAPPLSRPLAAASVPAQGLDVEIVADAAERESLAAENEVEAVERLVARLHVAPFGRDGLIVTGTLEAAARRICGVTLEPFVEEVREPIDLRFAPQEQGDAENQASDDPPDPLVGDAVDLGAIAAEFFTLGLSPHPRKPGAALDAEANGEDGASPFAALARLREKRD